MNGIFDFLAGAAISMVIVSFVVVLANHYANYCNENYWQQWNQPVRPDDVVDVPPEELEPPRY